MINSNHPQLPRGAIGFALGIAGMLVSLYYSIMFIGGNANGVEIIIGVIFALTLDYGKVALASEALIAMANFRLISAVVYSLIVISLYALSMFAATFMLTSHNTSAIAQQSDQQIATIQQSITEKRKELAACPSGIVTKCVNPRTAELTTLQNQLTEAQNVSGDIIAAKNTAATWGKMSKFLGMAPEDLQVKFSFARAFLLEIIAPILVSIFLTRYRSRLVQVQQQQERVVNLLEQPAAEQKTQQAQAPATQTPPPKVLPSYKVGGLKGLKW